MKRAEDMSTAELCEETLRLRCGTSEGWRADGWRITTPSGLGVDTLATFSQSNAYRADVELAARYHALAPELARRLRDRDQELREVRQALDLGPGEPLDGEIVEAIEELQRQAGRVAELEKIVSLLKCDAGRGAVS